MSDPANHTCPVCGYDGMHRPPKDQAICPCCGTQFGYDDASRTHHDLRMEWWRNGCQWWCEYSSPPPGWDGQEQLLKAPPDEEEEAWIARLVEEGR